MSVSPSPLPPALRNDRLLRALRLQPVDRTPIWFMRQAGRSLPEYRALKGKRSLFEICRDPAVCAQITLQPVRRLGVDAAILYSDIMVPLLGTGVDVQIVEGVGPVISEPVRAPRDVARLGPLRVAESIPWLLEDIEATLTALHGDVPLIGFSGAPFTLASYLVEGRPSRDFCQTKTLMYAHPDLWHNLMTRLAEIVATYMTAQVEAGVHALQLFDSWVGALSVDDYRRYVQPYSAHVLAVVTSTGIPVINFGTGTSGLLEAMRETGGTTIGVDWRVPLDVAWERIGHDRGIQGNLDPLVLLGPWEVVAREAGAVLERAGQRPGHVFNLGHGIHPSTSPENMTRLVDFVHERTART